MVLKTPLNTAKVMPGEITTVATAKMLVSSVRALLEVIPLNNLLWMVPSLMVTGESSLTQPKVNSLVSLSSSMRDNGEQYVMMSLTVPTLVLKLLARVLDSHGKMHANMTLKVVKVNQSGWTMFHVSVMRLPFMTAVEMISEIRTVVTVRMLVSSVKTWELKPWTMEPPLPAVISELYSMDCLNSLDALNTIMEEIGEPSVMTTSIKTTTVPRLPVDHLVFHGLQHTLMMPKVMIVNQLGLTMFLAQVGRRASLTAQEMKSETRTAATTKMLLFLVKMPSKQL